MIYHYGINWDSAYQDALSLYPELDFNISINECNSQYPGYYESTQCRIVSYLFDHNILTPDKYSTGYIYFAKNTQVCPESYLYRYLEDCPADLLTKLVLTGEITASYMRESIKMPLETFRDCLGDIFLKRFVELRNQAAFPITDNMLAEVYTTLWLFVSDKDPEETQIVYNSIGNTLPLSRTIPLYVRTFLALVHDGFIKDSRAKQHYANIFKNYGIAEL